MKCANNTHALRWYDVSDISNSNQVWCFRHHNSEISNINQWLTVVFWTSSFIIRGWSVNKFLWCFLAIVHAWHILQKAWNSKHTDGHTCHGHLVEHSWSITILFQKDNIHTTHVCSFLNTPSLDSPLFLSAHWIIMPCDLVWRATVMCMYVCMKLCGFFAHKTSILWTCMLKNVWKSTLQASSVGWMLAECSTSLPPQDVITWNVMIFGLLKCGQGQKAMNYFDKCNRKVCVHTKFLRVAMPALQMQPILAYTFRCLFCGWASLTCMPGVEAWRCSTSFHLVAF
jgi:pentatricopeptide repeat protein